MLTRRTPALLLVIALVATACAGGGGEGDGGPAEPEELVAQVASYDLAVGQTRRFIVGLLTFDNLFVSGGEATMRFSFLGEGEPEPGQEVPARFLGLPGEEPAHERTHVGPASEGRGVYASDEVTFDRPGPWQVEIEVEIGGETRSAAAAFVVVEEALIPDVGDRALPTENLTVDSEDAPPGAVDSRAETQGAIPDPELHATTIAAALEAGHPIVAVFATPVYCISQFCGPVTDMVAELAADYGDRADFVHIEIWRDFQNRVINVAAADWLLRNENLTEPWVFFIDAEGVIAARWDNVATRGEIEPFLQDLPPLRA